MKTQYLASLTDQEFKVVAGLMPKLGFKGLLGIVWELAEFRRLKGDKSAEQTRSERIARELGALIERLDGFESLEENKR